MNFPATQEMLRIYYEVKDKTNPTETMGVTMEKLCEQTRELGEEIPRLGEKGYITTAGTSGKFKDFFFLLVLLLLKQCLCSILQCKSKKPAGKQERVVQALGDRAGFHKT